MAYSVVVDDEFFLEWCEYFGKPQVWYTSYVLYMTCYKTCNGNRNEMKQNEIIGMNEIRTCNYIANPLFFCTREFRLGCKQREKRYSSTNCVSYMHDQFIDIQHNYTGRKFSISKST